MKVNKNSWHYRWFNYTRAMSHISHNEHKIDSIVESGLSVTEWYGKYVNYYQQDPTNFCQYWRSVLIKPIVVVSINLIFMAFLLSVISFIIFMAVTNPLVTLSVFGFLVGILAVLAFIVLATGGFVKLTDKIDQVKNDPDSFVANLYKTYKNKICTMMEYENDK